jgi:hypothetical protein
VTTVVKISVPCFCRLKYGVWSITCNYTIAILYLLNTTKVVAILYLVKCFTTFK